MRVTFTEPSRPEFWIGRRGTAYVYNGVTVGDLEDQPAKYCFVRKGADGVSRIYKLLRWWDWESGTVSKLPPEPAPKPEPLTPNQPAILSGAPAGFRGTYFGCAGVLVGGPVPDQPGASYFIRNFGGVCRVYRPLYGCSWVSSFVAPRSRPELSVEPPPPLPAPSPPPEPRRRRNYTPEPEPELPVGYVGWQVIKGPPADPERYQWRDRHTTIWPEPYDLDWLPCEPLEQLLDIPRDADA